MIRIVGLALFAALPLWAQNPLAIACPAQAQAGSSVVCSISLALAPAVTVDGLTFGVMVTPNGNAPALDADGQVSFTDSVGGAFTTTAGMSNAISAIWFHLTPLLSGTASLGSIAFNLPAAAVGGQTYNALITGGSASLDETTISLTSGAQATISIPGASLLFVSPNTALPGRTLGTVTIAGRNTNFVQGATTASFGAGIIVTSLTVNGPTSASAAIAIDANAAPGARDATLATGAESAVLAGGFTVAAPPPNPCDVTLDGAVTVADVQKMINEVLGLAPAADDLDGDGAVGIADLQIVLNNAVGLDCLSN